MTTEMSVAGHVTYKLRNAAINEWPFPHFYATEVFPHEFYAKLREQVAQKTDYKSGQNNYNGRLFAEDADLPGLEFMKTGEFARTVAKIFHPWLEARFEGGKCRLRSDIRLVRDSKDYFIGPHTDAPWKVVSLLFYLPMVGWDADCGTSIYVPKDPSFVCPGGPHYPFEGFERVHTAEYWPNACLGFFKTANSFHGVEPIDRIIQRDVLLYNLYDGNIGLQHSE
jgi:hypothetical protein